MLTPSDLHATLGTGMTTEAAAQMLRCTRQTVTRAANAYGIALRPRHARLRGEAEWRAAWEEHGPSVVAMSRALGMGHSYVHRKLEEYGIRPMRDPWAERQEAAE